VLKIAWAARGKAAVGRFSTTNLAIAVNSGYGRTVSCRPGRLAIRRWSHETAALCERSREHSGCRWRRFLRGGGP
jgi:hypothetical protein